MRRWRRGKWGVVEGLGTSPKKNHFFVPKMITTVFNRQNTRKPGNTDFTVRS